MIAMKQDVVRATTPGDPSEPYQLSSRVGVGDAVTPLSVCEAVKTLTALWT